MPSSSIALCMDLYILCFVSERSELGICVGVWMGEVEGRVRREVGGSGKRERIKQRSTLANCCGR